MRLFERELDLNRASEPGNLLAYFARAVEGHLGPGEHPVRVVVSATEEGRYHCEIGILATGSRAEVAVPSIFEFARRPIENTNSFNVILLVPTGMNATLGGHAGDAGPVARLLASVADTLITHPNVVNGSDINEL